MSVPIGGLRPVHIPFSGKVATDGTLTIKVPLRNIFWVSVEMAAQLVASTPTYAAWTMTLDGVSPVGFGLGANCEIGAFLGAPGQFLQVAVTGAVSGAALTGLLEGWEASNPQDLAMVYRATPTTFSGSTTSFVKLPTTAPQIAAAGSTPSSVIVNLALTTTPSTLFSVTAIGQHAWLYGYDLASDTRALGPFNIQFGFWTTVGGNIVKQGLQLPVGVEQKYELFFPSPLDMGAAPSNQGATAWGVGTDVGTVNLRGTLWYVAL